MNETTTEKQIADLMTTLGFGEIVLPTESVSGGFLHRMYRVTTERGAYAVKALNPEIMSRETARENYARAEAVEAILENEGLPIVPAIPVNGEKMQSLDGRYFYIFPWNTVNRIVYLRSMETEIKEAFASRLV